MKLHQLCVTGVAAAHTLPWKGAHKLAIKLAKQEAQRHKVNSWRVFDGQRVVGVSAAANPGEFAVLEEQGQVAVYRMPR